jgi:hypothetical protein
MNVKRRKNTDEAEEEEKRYCGRRFHFFVDGGGYNR